MRSILAWLLADLSFLQSSGLRASFGRGLRAAIWLSAITKLKELGVLLLTLGAEYLSPKKVHLLKYN